jgi:hypothetical protein
MGYKLKSAIEKNKTNLIIYAVLWLLFTIALIIPLSHSITKASLEGTTAITEMFSAYDDFGLTFSETFMPAYIGQFGKTLLIFSIIFLILIIISLSKSKSGDEYKDIEHGSSDWCEGGEQYSILSNKKGIILAENNYLPVDKRGNVNVLIVGRFRFW